ncbi:MAG: SpoIIE family protein phosphatase [Sandaracinaceae bacterium]
MIETHRMSLPCLGGGHDRAAVFRNEIDSPDHLLIVVADGAGSQRGATAAVDLLIDGVRERFERRSRPLGPVGLRRELERLDALLRDEADGGQSTAVLIEVVGDAFWGASVGDSGAWLVLGDEHLDLTRGQDRKWRLGTGFATPRAFGPMPLLGTLMVGTDGLFECAAPDHLSGQISAAPLEAIARSLVHTVRTPDGGLRDDLALVLLRPAAAAAQQVRAA